MELLNITHINHFFGGLQAIREFNLTLREGELLGLIGPNGAGKTTVFNLVSGFYQPSEGQIVFMGKNIANLRPHKVTALGLARTFQNIRLWDSMTVLENLSISQHYQLGYGFWGAMLWTKTFRNSEKAVRHRAQEMLEVLDLKDAANEYPKNLPYGMQRRVEIGRALTVSPKLLLLDEPAAGMNPSEIEQLIDLIRWIKGKFNLTIWLIEHQMKVVMSLCDRIKVLDFGETIADGTPSEIRNNPRVIKAYLGDEG